MRLGTSAFGTFPTWRMSDLSPECGATHTGRL